MRKIVITVVKKAFNEDLVQAYGDKAWAVAPCTDFEVGQEFVMDADHTYMPEGFCSWAWADIQRDVEAIGHGASYPWIEGHNAIVSCCTDGLRPVSFRIERMEE